MSGDSADMLRHALEYAGRGWSVIPIRRGTKRPAVDRWGHFQDMRPGEKRLRRWFGNGADHQLAVVGGAVSGGLVVRDFDRMEAYRSWQELQPDPARQLPTVQTVQGRHVYFRSADTRYRKLEDGEYRGEGHYTLVPPSIHPEGKAYQWLIDLPDGDLPMIDPVEFGLLREEMPDEPAAAAEPIPGLSRPPMGLTHRTQRFLAIGAAEGHRNDELFCAGCDMTANGIGRQEAKARLLEGCRLCQPSYPASEAKRTIASAYSKPRTSARSSADPWGSYCIPRLIATRRDLLPTDKLVWTSLDYRQRNKATCWPSLDTIAKDVGVSRDTACNAVGRLAEADLLNVKKTIGDVNHYTTRLPKCPEAPPVEKPDTNNHGRKGWTVSPDGELG